MSTTVVDAPAGPSSYDIECIRDERRFAHLAGDWNRLADETDPDSVFLRHEWFESAWQWRRRESQLRLFTVRRGDALVGVVPLILCRERRRHVPIRVMRFLSVPDTQHCAILAGPDDRTAVAALAIEWLKRRKDWDLLDLEHLRTAGPAWRGLEQAVAHHGLQTGKAEPSLNPRIDLTGDWKTFYATRSRRLKKANNLVANHLARAHADIELRRITRATLPGDNLESLMDIIAGLSATSWKRTTGLSLDQPGPAAFIRHLARVAHANDWLAVWLLELDGIPVAMEFQLVYRGHVHALRADFDEARSKLSPGSYLNWKILENLFGTGNRRYWMGPGRNTYKLHWTEQFESLTRMIAYSHSVRGRLLAIAEERIRPLVKRLLRSRAHDDSQPERIQ